jgi:hypothetical protein
MGGPLIVLPVSRVAEWKGFEDGGERDGKTLTTDYDRACAIRSEAGVISVGTRAGQALVLEGASTVCYRPTDQLFVQWIGADSEESLMAAADFVVSDPASRWESCGSWDIDEDAILMDSFFDGAQMNVEDDQRPGTPQPALVSVPPGRWSVRAGRWTVAVAPAEKPTAGLVQLIH